MKPVQNMHGLVELLANHIHVRLPHIATHELDTLAYGCPKAIQARTEAGFCPIFSNGKQSLQWPNLINESQVLMSRCPGNLINSDRRDSFQISVLQAPFDRMLYRAANTIPGSPEDRSGLAPTESLGPSYQEPNQIIGQTVLPTGPWHHFNLNAALFTVHTTHSICKKDRKPPQRNKLKPSLFQAIVKWARLSAT